MTNEYSAPDTDQSASSAPEAPARLERTGAHRAPVARRRWVTFAWAALATGLLVAVGTLGLFAYNGKLDIVAWLFPNGGGAATPTATAAPTVDPKMKINVLNGTARPGLAAEAGATLEKAGWVVAAKSSSNETTVKKTMVFYAVATYEGAARGVCQSLAAPCQIKFTQAFASSDVPLTLVIGANFPASSPATASPTPSNSAK